MKPEGKALHFFLGSNTPQGFVSRFDQLADADGGWRCFIIKGGPGSGKSTIMKRVASHLMELGRDVEIIHCSSDVDSLDGVICPSLKISFADGTPPHAIEPRFPGAFESIVDLTSCWNDDTLFANREEIIRLFRGCSRCHEHCCRYLGAAASLAGDTYRIALDCLDSKKLEAYCKRLAEKELRPVKSRKGKESIRVFSAVTNQGVVAFTDSAKLLCKRIYLISDENGAVSRVLLQNVRSAALGAGHEVISCYCPLSPFEKLEFLFLPEIGAGFLTSNSFHDFSRDVEPYRIINSRRFTDEVKLRENRKRLGFNRKAASQMISRADGLLREAKGLHDELEGLYADAIDFSEVEALTVKLLDRVADLDKRQ